MFKKLLIMSQVPQTEMPILYNLANVLAYNAELYTFYLNQVANEVYLDTAKLYKNVNRISNL
jgi:hypothetical protein